MMNIMTSRKYYKKKKKFVKKQFYILILKLQDKIERTETTKKSEKNHVKKSN